MAGLIAKDGYEEGHTRAKDTPMLSRIRRLPEYVRFLRRVYHYRWPVAQMFEFIECPYQDLMGSTHPNEWELLTRLVKEAAAYPGPIIELGTLFGLTTVRMADAKRHDQELITVDNYTWNPLGFRPDKHREFTKLVLLYITRNCNTRIYDGDSATFWHEYNGPPPAMVFIDASHEYEHVKQDIQSALEKKIQIIAGHDYRPEWPSVQKAVDECLGSDIEVGGSVWAHRTQP
jgi:hypothetical protein